MFWLTVGQRTRQPAIEPNNKAAHAMQKLGTASSVASVCHSRSATQTSIQSTSSALRTLPSMAHRITQEAGPVAMERMHRLKPPSREPHGMVQARLPEKTPESETDEESERVVAPRQTWRGARTAQSGTLVGAGLLANPVLRPPCRRWTASPATRAESQAAYSSCAADARSSVARADGPRQRSASPPAQLPEEPMGAKLEYAGA
mmetsp:Transcript_20971/g.59622  ORF Transcript_20971/g.59622 Transcript_20971/m.59622 type:complete len:204 (-) Transcript_20971:394-1005(-)